MRHPGLTVVTWLILILLNGLGILAGFFFTYNKSDLSSVGIVALIFSVVAGWLCSLLVSSTGNGGVITTFPGKGDHDLVFGGTYQVLSCVRLIGKAYRGEDDKYVVVLEDADGVLWSCVLPEEPPAHFVYTRGDKRFVPYTAPATATPAPATTTASETVAAS